MFGLQVMAGSPPHSKTLRERIVIDSFRDIGQSQLYLPEDRYRLSVESNPDCVNHPQTPCIYQLFECQVERTPDAIALRHNDEQITYQALNDRADQLANYLIGNGVTLGVRIGLYMDRSIDLIVAMIGVLKVGGVYVPLDPDYPVDRTRQVLEDVSPRLILASDRYTQLARGVSKVNIVDCRAITRNKQIDIAADRSNRQSCLADVDRDTGRAAYIVYTSGSSGGPKGVIGTQRGVVNRCKWMWANYPFIESDVCCQKTSVSFVDSVWEIWGPLLNGVPIVILPNAIVQDVRQFVKALTINEVTRIVLVPSLLKAILDYLDENDNDLPALTHCSSSGEVLPVSLARRFMRRFPGRTLLNLYGSSEVAADATCHEIPRDRLTDDVPIGRPIDNCRVYVLDEDLRSVPVGAEGELYVAGAGLALGYWNDEAQTACRFVPDPFHQGSMFRTGDLGNMDADGDLHFRGRIDHQIKIRGHRVEPQEIETVCTMYPGIRECVVCENSSDEGAAALVGYYIVGANNEVDVDDLYPFLRSKLPSYLVPSDLIEVPELPRLPNGKLDRLKLLGMSATPMRRRASGAASVSRTQSRLLDAWTRVLDKNAIDIDDNFFERGGHSLLAVSLIDKIEHEFQVEFPLALIFQHPTIREQARWIDGINRENSLPLLITLREQGFRYPIFFVPPAGGTGMYFTPLADCFEPGYPLYSFDSLYVTELESVEQMASAYIEEMRRVRPDGPYILVGACFGSHIALEIAQQLSQQNVRVEMLVVVDASAPFAGPTWQTVATRPSLMRKLKMLRSSDRSYFIRLFIQRKKRALKSLFSKNIKIYRDALYTQSKVVSRYRAKAWTGNILLIQSEYFSKKPEIASRWSALTQANFTRKVLPSTQHHELVKKDSPYWQNVAKLICDANRNPSTSCNGEVRSTLSVGSVNP